MDPRLEDVDKMLSTLEDDIDTEMELSFAIGALDENDPATLYWLATIAVAHANREN